MSNTRLTSSLRVPTYEYHWENQFARDSDSVIGSVELAVIYTQKSREGPSNVALGRIVITLRFEKPLRLNVWSFIILLPLTPNK